MLEIWPDSFPDLDTPTYGVDDWGFYSVSGSFPPNLDTDTRSRFAEDMKMIVTVGFRSYILSTLALVFSNKRQVWEPRVAMSGGEPLSSNTRLDMVISLTSRINRTRSRYR